MKDVIIAVVLIVVLAVSIGYIIKAKKSGVKCIGCPSGKECASKNKGGCSCGCGYETDSE